MKTNIVFNLCLAIVSILFLNQFANAQNDCGNYAGDPQPEQILCSGTPAVGPAVGAILAPNNILKYYLHEGDISNFIDSNFNGIFSNLGSYPPNTQLYISAAVGIPDANNNLNLTDPCTDFQFPGSRVTFLNPITITHQFTCNDNSVDVSYTLNGGLPAALSSNYTVQGSTSNTASPNINNGFNLPSLNGTYILFVEDDNGCEASVTQPYQCGMLDFAIIKRLAAGQSSTASPGSIVTFTFEIINQGNVPVSQVSIIDYIPNDLILSDPNWVQIGQTAGVLLNPPPPASQFLPGGIYAFNITFTVSPSTTVSTITNSAEIAFVNLGVGEIVYSDDDSTYDINPNNNGTPIDNIVNDPSDNDAHDIETINIKICEGIAGTMPEDTVFACYNNTASAIQNGSVLAAGDVDMYVLHTLSSGSLVTIVDSNNTGVFNNPDDDCRVLYISYVFGPDDGSGKPDLNDECTIVLPGTPVEWSAPININASENCDPNTQMYIVRYDISGGFAECNNSFYNVTGDVNPVMALPGQTYVNTTSFGNNSSYSITVTDNRGCAETINNGPIACEDTNPCGNNPGTMPGDVLYGCAGAQLSATESNSQLSNSDVGFYILHNNASNTLGNITASNNTGTFNDPQSPCNTLYISYVFGPDDGSGEPDLDNDCTIILPGTPVVWASPISIMSQINCDQTTETFTYNYTVTGGFPSCNSGNYTMSGDVNLTTASEGTTYDNSTVFNHLDSYMITATDEQGCSFTLNSNPVFCQSANTCGNESGMMPTTPIEACANTDITATENGSMLAPSDVSIYYLHDSATGLGNILASSTTGTFADPASSCTTLYISYVFGQDDGNGLPDLNDECTKILNGTPVLWVPEVTLTSTSECVTGVNEYLISYTVGGGKASCDASAAFSILGTFTENNIAAGSNTHPNSFAGGTSYQITATDNLGCNATFSSNEPINCLGNLPFCGNTQGVMQAADNPKACSQSTITAIQYGAYLQSGYTGQYYLHTNAGTTLGNVISSNNTGTFNDPNMPCTTLYISYVFGLDDGNGNVLLDDDCTFVLEGTPVSWAESLSISTSENCNQNTGTYTVNLNISGGFAACDNTLTYTVSGDVTLAGVAAGSYVSPNTFNGGSSYTITLEDGNNCINNFTSEPIACEIVCGNNTGTPNAAQILCENDITNGSIANAIVSPGANLVYVLHNGVNVLDTIYAVNSSGTFLNDGTYPVNRQLYISAVIGNIANNDSIPNLSDMCTEVALPGTPVVFLTDVSITTDVMCNESTGVATIDYVANGGHPAFDNSLSYTITGDAGTTALFGETKTFTNSTGSFTLTATDNLDCSSTISQLTNCSMTMMCINQIGAQSSTAKSVCAMDSIDASSEGYLVGGPGATLVYVLHDGNTNLGAIIDTNSTGIFENTGTYNTDIQYYISAMIGILNPAGIPDLNDECTIGNFPGTPVTFLDALEVEQRFECMANGEALVTLSISGGTGNYSITGSFTGSASEDEMITFNNAAGNTSYTLDITDSNGCKEMVEQTYECVVNCMNDAGIISGEVVTLCDSETFDFSINNATIQDGYSLIYALHSGSVNSIIDFNNNGTFINDGSYAVNTEYFVSPLVTTLVNGEPDLEDACLSITLPGRSVWFLSPITINETIDCAETANAYRVNFSIMGGAPGAVGIFEDSYTVSGILGTVTTMGQLITSAPQSIPQNNDYVIEITDSEGCMATFFGTNENNCNDCLELNESSIPNIFSPNNDSVNRIWGIPNLQACYPNNRVLICNRWGNIVWEQNSCADNCWDGTAQNSGKPLPTGAYYYVIQLNGENSNEAEVLSGTITLLR